MTDTPDDNHNPTFTRLVGVRRADVETTLDYLRSRLGLALTDSYRNPLESRHVHAVALVDVGTRLLYLHQQIAEAATTGTAELSTLARHAQERLPFRSTPEQLVVSPVVERLPQLTARVQELENVLGILDGAYRAAWDGHRVVTE